MAGSLRLKFKASFMLKVTLLTFKCLSDLECFSFQNPGFDFSNAKLDKRYDDKHIKDMERIAEAAKRKSQ